MNEYIKAIKVIHQIVILVSAAVLAFALTPNLGPKFGAADDTLSLLQEQTEDSWDQYVYELERDNQVRENAYVNDLAAKLDPSHRPATYAMFIYSDLHYPLGGTMADIRRYLEATQTLQQISLKRERATLEKQWLQAFPTRAPGALNGPADVHAAISDINVVPPGGGWPGNPFTRVRILALAQANSDRTTRIQITIDPTSPSQPTTGNHVVDLLTSCDIVARRNDNYALKWLLDDNYGGARSSNGQIQHEKLRPDQDDRARRAQQIFGETLPQTAEDRDKQNAIIKSELSRTVLFPSLQPFWDELATLTISQARDKLRSEREAQHGKVSLFGLSVDPSATVRVMPWVLCSLMVFMTAHLRQAQKSHKKLTESAPAWVGLFDDWTGTVVSVVTIPLLPALSCIILVRRYGTSYGFLNFDVVSLLVLIGIGGWTFIELVKLRRHAIKMASETTTAISHPDAKQGRPLESSVPEPPQPEAVETQRKGRSNDEPVRQTPLS